MAKGSTKKKRLRMYHQVNQTERILLRMFQKHQLNLNYFPALGSVPLKENFYFLTAPQWWQSWIILEIINKTEVNQCISLSFVTRKVYELVEAEVFQLRLNCLHPKDVIRRTVIKYLEVLCLFQALEKKYNGVFLVKNHINIHKQLDTLCLDDLYVIEKMKGEWEKT